MSLCPSCGLANPKAARFCNACGASLASQEELSEQRKTVTVLFCDVTGSTALGESTDAEALRAVLARYFERMKAIVESHGGSVEKFVGDAVMAVFGVPLVHENDALRATRAAVAMREALPELGVQARIGVNTGEVVTGTAERLVTGDAVNVAARLEQAAAPGEILIAEETVRLVREAVETEPVEPLVVRGKVEPVSAHRLLSVHEPPGRRLEAPMVGRERELTQLRAAFAEAVAENSCQLFTVVGEAGVGKSRLVREFLTVRETTTAVGRCLPYGEGITYGPVVEVLKQLAVRPSEPAAAAAIGSLLGESEGNASAEEIAWAFRKTLEQAAAARPLVCVFDDIHWGEPTFLELVEHVALLSSRAPILLLCMARHELTERRPTWPVALRLEPLPDEGVARLMPETIEDDLRDQIARAAGGNPLFVEEMVAMAVEVGGNVVVPASLRALLAARLDQLPSEERRVLQCAAVEGEVFHRGAVHALTAGEGQATPRLAALVRKGLITPHPAQLTGEDGFRFRHLLLRDAAYEALTKTSRAELHQRFAIWLEQGVTKPVELSELVGYHLEQAYRFRRDLGDADEILGSRAAEALALAGNRALARGDAPAAAVLLRRVRELPTGTPERRTTALLDLAAALRESSALAEAAGAIDEAVASAKHSGDRKLEARAMVEHCHLSFFTSPVEWMNAALPTAQRAIGILEQEGDDPGLAAAWMLILLVHYARCQIAEMERAAEPALRHARRAGDARLAANVLNATARAALVGPTPVAEAIERCRRIATENDRDPNLEAVTLGVRAYLEAMRGRFAEARDLYARCHSILEELGRSRLLASTRMYAGHIELLAGDPAAAEHEFRASCDALEAIGDHGSLATAAVALASSLYEQGLVGEANAFTELSERMAAYDDLHSIVPWHATRARLEARQGDFVLSEQLAAKAVALAGETDHLNMQGDALASLAVVLEASGRPSEAERAAAAAVERYDRKGNLVMAKRMRAQLAR